MGANSIGGRDDYFVATAKTAQGAEAYDSDGIIISGGAVTTIEFYGKVMDMPSDKTNLGRKYRDVTDFVVECDAVDVEGLTADFTVRIDGSTDIFSVVDVYDVQYKFVSHVVLKHIAQ